MSNNKPEVKLISKPNNLLKTIYTACRTCYSADTPINIYDTADDEEKMLKLISRVISSGHYSTIEHIQISFAISNVSRACTHQLVRHRHMSFSQKSQRYVKEKGQFDYIIPPTIEKNPELKRIPNRLETLRKIVGNEYIDVIKYKDVLIVFDEEAYKKLLPINRTLDGLNIRGTFIVTGNDKKNQDFKDLTKEQIEEYTKKFQLEQENQMEEGEELEWEKEKSE